MKKWIVIALCLAMLLSLSACGSNEVSVNKDPVYGGTITISGYYDAPPAVNGNVMTSSGSPDTIHFQYQRLVEYAPFDENHYHMMLAEDFVQSGNQTIVTLREGLKWSDGTDLTSKDVVCSFHMYYLQDYAVWQDLESVEATDDRTIVFTWHEFSETLLIRLFNLQINMSYANYGEWADQAVDFLAQRTWDEENLQYKDHPYVSAHKALVLQECYKWLPDLEDAMCSGAYMVSAVSTSEIQMVKNPYYYNADNVYIDNIKMLRFVSTESYLATAMSGGYDLEVHGLLPDMYNQVTAANPNMTTIYTPELSQAALQFNINVYPLDKQEVRQAIAHVVDRDILLSITEVGMAAGDVYCSGLTPVWRDTVLTDELKSQLTEYTVNYEKADELLSSLGWTRGSDNYWVDENGDVVELEISTMNSWAAFFTCSEAAAVMLDEYGLKCSMNALELSAYWSYIEEGKHMICCDSRGGSPKMGAWEAYSGIYEWSGLRTGIYQYYGAGKNEDGDIIPLVIENDAGEEINVTETIRLMLYGTEDQKTESIETLMKLTNEKVYIIPLSEKYSPVKIYNEKLAGYPDDNMNWVYNTGDMLAVARLLCNGYLYFTE